MKYLLYAFLILTAINSEALSQEYHQNRIIVKFADSELAQKWFASGRNFEIHEWSEILGTHQVLPYIDDRLLKLVKQRKPITKHSEQKLGAFRAYSELPFISCVQYTSSIDPRVAAAKISSLDGVVYAEPEPVSKIFVQSTNDPLIGNQYYLNQVKALEAWDYVADADTIVIGIVDTGIDYNHEDLAGNIFKNYGEIGTDLNGTDKRGNGIDDDENGFVDDWQGWDFLGNGDNNPIPGHLHGTHVAGTCGAVVNNEIGISGVAPKVKLLAVKIGYDSQFATSIINGYQGLLYAAAMGSDIINCSWGSASYSNAEAEVVAEAVSLGSLIVAAAGNDYRNQAHYPSSYNGVVSVAAVDSTDAAAWFTTYHRSVDVSAPGVDVFATTPLNGYESLDGTSMASPVAAGVAALIKMKYPEKNNLQIGEILKATTDNIDSLNPFYRGLIGTGRVNALKALTSTSYKSIILSNSKVNETAVDGEYLHNEKLLVDISVMNILDKSEGISVKLSQDEQLSAFTLIRDSVFIGNLNELESFDIKDAFEVIINPDTRLDQKAELIFTISDNSGYSSSSAITLTLLPSYKTMDANKITATFNASGNIAFNDYPDNSQGVGFKYNGFKNILFEGALMIAVGDKLYDVARSDNQMAKRNSFVSDKAFQLNKIGSISKLDGKAEFRAINGIFENVGLDIHQSALQFNEPDNENIIFSNYTLLNNSPSTLDSVFVGLYFDWDIFVSGNNQIYWDSISNIGIAKHLNNDTIPMIAVIPLSPVQFNFWAIDNNGNTEENPGVYDGFYPYEKLKMLSSGIGREISAITDVSMVIGNGPFQINQGDSVIVPFAIAVAYQENELRKAANTSRRLSILHDLAKTGKVKDINKTEILSVFPNPVGAFVNVKLYNSKEGTYDVVVYDLQGRKKNLLSERIFVPYGMIELNYDLSFLANGTYFISFEQGKSQVRTRIVKE